MSSRVLLNKFRIILSVLMALSHHFVFAQVNGGCDPHAIEQTISSWLFPLRIKTPKATPSTQLVQGWIESWKKDLGTTWHFSDFTDVLDWTEKEMALLASSPNKNVGPEATKALARIKAFRAMNPLKHDISFRRDLLKLFADSSAIFSHAYPEATYSKSAFTQFDKLVRDLLRTESAGYDHCLRVTEKALTVREINDLSPYPIYVLGVTAKPAVADGIKRSALGFIEHDLAHAFGKFSAIDEVLVSKIEMGDIEGAKKILAERESFYAHFRALVAKTPDKKQRELLELLWFDVFHERNAPMVPKSLKLPQLVPTEERWAEEVYSKIRNPGDYGNNISVEISQVSVEDVKTAIKRIQTLAEEKL